MSHAAPANTEAREAFYNAIEPESTRALWSVMGAIITPEPKSGCQPVMWKYDTVRARLMEAAGLITAKEAERRVQVASCTDRNPRDQATHDRLEREAHPLADSHPGRTVTQ